VVYSSGVKEYKYIVFLNGIVWDSVSAPNIRVAKRRAYKMVRNDSQTFSLRYKDLSKVVTLETVRTFLGK